MVGFIPLLSLQIFILLEVVSCCTGMPTRLSFAYRISGETYCELAELSSIHPSRYVALMRTDVSVIFHWVF
jgi:hypothetical protein